MKTKKCCALLCVFSMMISLCGCDMVSKNKESLSDTDIASIEKMQKIVKELDKYTDELNEGIVLFEEKGIFDDESSDTLDKLIEQENKVNEYCETAKKIKVESDNKAVKDTYSQYIRYINEVSELYCNVLDISDFLIGVIEVETEMDDIWESYDDELDQVENTYIQWDDLMDKYREVKCPAFMQDTYDLYVEAFEEKKQLYYEWFYAVELQDNLRINAVINCIDVTDSKIDKYTDKLLDDVSKQYSQSKKLINDRIEVYEKELTDGFESLLETVKSEEEK